MSIKIYQNSEFVIINYKHSLKLSKGNKLELSGLNPVKTIFKYFGGTFEIFDLKNDFSVNISIPIGKS